MGLTSSVYNVVERSIDQGPYYCPLHGVKEVVVMMVGTDFILGSEKRE